MIYKLFDKKLRIVLLKRKFCKVQEQSKFYKGFQFLLAFASYLFVIDIYSKYASVALLKNKTGLLITIAF